MDTFLKMDIFFFVATLATILIAVGASIALFYLIRLIRTIDRLLLEVEDEAKLLRSDLKEARLAAKKQGAKVTAFISFIDRTARRLLGKKR